MSQPKADTPPPLLPSDRRRLAHRPRIYPRPTLRARRRLARREAPRQMRRTHGEKDAEEERQKKTPSNKRNESRRKRWRGERRKKAACRRSRGEAEGGGTRAAPRGARRDCRLLSVRIYLRANCVLGRGHPLIRYIIFRTNLNGA